MKQLKKKVFCSIVLLLLMSTITLATISISTDKASYTCNAQTTECELVDIIIHKTGPPLDNFVNLTITYDDSNGEILSISNFLKKGNKEYQIIDPFNLPNGKKHYNMYFNATGFGKYNITLTDAVNGDKLALLDPFWSTNSSGPVGYSVQNWIQSNTYGVNPINVSYQIDNQNHFFYEFAENPPTPNPTPFPNSTNWGSPVDATSNLMYEDAVYETTIAPSTLHRAAGVYQLFEFNVGSLPTTAGNIYVKLKYDGAQPANTSISIWNESGSNYLTMGTFNGTNLLYNISLTPSQVNDMLDNGKLYFAASATKDTDVGGIVLSTDYIKLEIAKGGMYGFRETHHYQQPVSEFTSANFGGYLRWLNSNLLEDVNLNLTSPVNKTTNGTVYHEQRMVDFVFDASSSNNWLYCNLYTNHTYNWASRATLSSVVDGSNTISYTFDNNYDNFIWSIKCCDVYGCAFANENRSLWIHQDGGEVIPGSSSGGPTETVFEGFAFADIDDMILEKTGGRFRVCSDKGIFYCLWWLIVLFIILRYINRNRRSIYRRFIRITKLIGV